MQTKTAVHSSQDAKRQRQGASAKAYQALCAVMLFCQLLLYGNLQVLKQAGNASWWLAAALFIPGGLLYGSIRWITGGGRSLTDVFCLAFGRSGAAVCGIYYALLLGLDIQLLLSGLTELTASYVIEEGSVWSMALWGVIAGSAGVWLGREMGAARCCYLLRWLLAAVLVACIASALPMGDAAFLFPWQFKGLTEDLRQGINWSGSLWPVILMGFWPKGAKGEGSLRFWPVAAALAGLMLVFFGYCFVLPGAGLMAPMTWGERMVLFLQGTPSKLLWELLLNFKMVIMLLSLTGAASLAGRLIARLAIPKIHPGIWGTLLIAAAFPLAGTHTQWSQDLLAALGPWRLPAAVLPLGAAGLSLIVRKGRKRA